ncbi:extracellular calcium-sensing receptor-like [Pleurodeles waltl]|uniref:extracellular calcium-sensing receptor-like n=1 Tax=Pleurodeles waltl TaxID=8319 RepID=UPI003709AC02
MKFSSLLLLLFMPAAGHVAEAAGCTLRSHQLTGYQLDGDALIGAIFPASYSFINVIPSFTESPTFTKCNTFYLASLVWVEALAFTIAEINREQLILPNMTLGFVIFDTCLSLPKALQGTLWMLTGQPVSILNYRCQSSAPLAAFLGDASSGPTIPMARLLGLYRYPQGIILEGPSECKNRESYLIRFIDDYIMLVIDLSKVYLTVPSDEAVAMVIAQLVMNFGWTWVGLLSTNNDYGEIGSQFMKKELLKYGICIAFHEVIPVVSSLTRIKVIVELVKMSTAKVVIVFGSEPYIVPVFRGLAEVNKIGTVWIAVDSWSFSPFLVSKSFSVLLSGTVGLAMHKGEMTGFREFLLQIRPSHSPKDMFAKPIWEIAFGCQWPSSDNNQTLTSANQGIGAMCSGKEDLEKITNPDIQDPDIRINYSVYMAAYSVAYALREMVSCVPGNGPFLNRMCAELKTFQPWQLLHYMKKLRFKNKSGKEMYFDNNGDPPTQYDIVNWQMKADGTLQHVKVGHFDARASVEKQFNINSSAIQWNMQRVEVPRSVCSESCAPGYRMAHQEGRPACCFDCIPCAEGEIANRTGSSTCWQCPSDKWPNEIRSECVPKRIEYLSYNEPLGSTLTTTASLSSFTAAAVLCVFIKYRETAIVKANNRELSYLLLGALALSFLSSLLFIGEPHPTTCLLQHLAFGIIFVLCVSCVLAKTVMVVIAFNATKPDSNMRKWLGPRVPLVTVSICTLLQVVTCATWLLLCPPFPEKNMKMKTGTIVFKCNECSEIALWFMLGYMGLLACASFLVAFVSRNLPDSFNEAKWITFSMIVFLSVWLSFIPGYLSTQGKNMVAVEVFSIIASSAGLLSCIFLPKCYIILLRPEMNTREHLLGKGRIKQTKTSVAL